MLEVLPGDSVGAGNEAPASSDIIVILKAKI